MENKNLNISNLLYKKFKNIKFYNFKNIQLKNDLNITIIDLYRYSNDWVSFRKRWKNNDISNIEKINYLLLFNMSRKFKKILKQKFLNQLENISLTDKEKKRIKNKHIYFIFEYIEYSYINIYIYVNKNIKKFFHLSLDGEVNDNDLIDFISEYNNIIFETNNINEEKRIKKEKGEEYLNLLLEKEKIQFYIDLVIVKYNYNFFKNKSIFREIKFIPLILESFKEFKEYKKIGKNLNKIYIKSNKSNEIKSINVIYDIYISIFNNILTQWLGSNWILNFEKYNYIYDNISNRKNVINSIYYSLLEKYIKYLMKNLEIENELNQIYKEIISNKNNKEENKNIKDKNKNLYEYIYDLYVQYILDKRNNLNNLIFNKYKNQFEDLLRLYNFKENYIKKTLSKNEFLKIYSINYLNIIKDKNFWNYLFDQILYELENKIDLSISHNNKKDLIYFQKKKNEILKIKEKINKENNISFKDFIKYLNLLLGIRI